MLFLFTYKRTGCPCFRTSKVVGGAPASVLGRALVLGFVQWETKEKPRILGFPRLCDILIFSTASRQKETHIELATKVEAGQFETTQKKIEGYTGRHVVRMYQQTLPKRV